ncbi:hypothetical protein ANN_03829 [Periplaneta americana]|uniref:Uncharacterized protein n=1 Tax=Periplaneta americana TaxID=6978 RepID=A0ABQ8TZZ2_PERAM|nr:hypothetical protein ANN_03829 [Periplaneta americana]
MTGLCEGGNEPPGSLKASKEGCYGDVEVGGVVTFRRNFIADFLKAGPMDKTIHTLLNKFKCNGAHIGMSVIEAIRLSIERSPKSVRHLLRELNILHSTVHRRCISHWRSHTACDFFVWDLSKDMCSLNLLPH